MRIRRTILAPAILAAGTVGAVIAAPAIAIAAPVAATPALAAAPAAHSASPLLMFYP